MKKFISGLLVLMLIASMLTVNAAAGPKFARAAATTAENTVNLSLQALEKTTNGRFVIHYDPAVLELLETKLPTSVQCWEAAAGTVQLAYTQAKAIEPMQTLAELQFAFTGHRTVTEISVVLEDFNYREGMHLELDTLTVDPELPFTDVAPDDWFHDTVKEAYQDGWVNGVSESLFLPGGSMTRAMFVTMLGRMEGVSDTAPEKTAFIDVDPDAYYAPYVQWAVEEGIVKGADTEHFCPDRQVSRQQIVTFLYRYAAVLGMDTTADRNELNRFADSKEVSDFALDAMSWAIEQKLIEGTPRDLAPRATATRAQGTTFLVRFSHMNEKG